MTWIARMGLSLFLFVSTTTVSFPSNVVGRWKVGKPYEDMTPQPVGLTNSQLKKLIGQNIQIAPTFFMACGKRVAIDSPTLMTYSAEEYRQRYSIRPDQIGLKSPVTEISLNFSRAKPVCGNGEGWSILTDGQNATLENGNEYFKLTKDGSMD